MQPKQVLRVDEIDLSDLEFWARPLEEREGAFLTLREEKPIGFWAEPDITASGIEVGPGYWAVTRHADILEVSRQPEIFRSGQGAVSITDMPEFMLDFFGSLINMDDPRHARLRKIVSHAFTPRRLRDAEEGVQRAATRIVDDLLRSGGGDFVTDVAARLPLRVICEMMGIPESEEELIFSRSNVVLGYTDAEYVPQEDQNVVLQALLTAGSELHALVSDLGKFRREHPSDDLTSALVNANIDGEHLTDAELGSFFILLVVAGNETTRNAISHALDLLTRYPDQKAIWQADIDGVAPTAVEEIVRVASPVVWMRRTAAADTVLRGQEIKAGDKVLMYYWSANRDPDVFDDPFRFDVLRTPNDHVGFGGPGPHFCLGAHLARREITVMLRELLRRTPNLRATSEAQRLRSGFINGIKHLSCEV